MASKPSKLRDATRIPALIIYAAKILEFLSPSLAATFAARLFTTPLKYNLPKRELEMDRHSRQETVHIPSINKNVVVYHYGTGEKKILLVHGWSGRGTQLVKLADAFVAAGFETISFDAPAHGKSAGKRTLMPEFVAVILQLQKKLGPIYGAVGHSLGGMSLLNAVKRGLHLERLVIIGSGDVVQDIIDEFTDKMKLSRKTGLIMRRQFEKSGETMDSYSAYIAAREAKMPVLVIHDEGDSEIGVDSAKHIHEHLPNGKLMITKGLGHRKILGNQQVIEQTTKFVAN